MLLRYLALTKNKANDVIKPSLVSSHGPPYSSSSIFWKFVKYMYKTPAFIRANLKIIKLWLFSHNQLPKTINKFILFTKLIHHHMKTGNEKKKLFIPRELSLYNDKFSSLIYWEAKSSRQWELLSDLWSSKINSLTPRPSL